jgi:hypothetical protein
LINFIDIVKFLVYAAARNLNRSSFMTALPEDQKLLLLCLQRTVGIALRVIERNAAKLPKFASLEDRLCKLQTAVFHHHSFLKNFPEQIAKPIDEVHAIIMEICKEISVFSADGNMCDLALIQLQQYAAPMGLFTYFVSSDPEGPPSSSSRTIVKMSSGTRQYMTFGGKFTFPPPGEGEVIFPRLHKP